MIRRLLRIIYICIIGKHPTFAPSNAIDAVLVLNLKMKIKFVQKQLSANPDSEYWQGAYDALQEINKLMEKI